MGPLLYFRYGRTETDYLKSKDPRLGEVIDRIGHLRRPVESDLFSSVVRSIVAQQISGKAFETVWNRFLNRFSAVTPETVNAAEISDLQQLGISFKKAEYIKDFARRVAGGALDLHALKKMSDAEAVAVLSRLKGIGVWTAEMLLLFSLRRPDILSFGDFGIQRGMRMVYRHRKITRPLFEKYRKRLSPYGSVASLYFWAVAGGAVPELTDPAPKKKPLSAPLSPLFVRCVLSAVAAIPPGCVATYGQIARLAGREKNARQVGKILSVSGKYGDYPCHRVVSSTGRTAPGFEAQRRLLLAEGVAFKPNGCVDLKKHVWVCR